MPNYMDNFNVDDFNVGSEFINMSSSLSRKQREAISAAIEKSKVKEAGDLQVESAKAGAWQGYTPGGTGPDPNVAQNYPDTLTSQGLEAKRLGGFSRVQNLQGISQVARQKNASDEATAQIKRLTDLTTQAKTQMEVIISSDNYTNKSMDELIAKKNRYEKTGNSYPSDVLDFEIKQINRVRELARLEPITVRDLNNINEFKTKIGVRDSETVVKNYNELLKPDTAPERKAELIGELSSQVPEIRKRNADPKMFAEIDKALEQQTAELAKLTFEKNKNERPYKIGQRLPAREEGLQNVVDVVIGYDAQGLPITKPVSRGDRFKPEDVVGKAEKEVEKKQLIADKKEEKKQAAKNALDKWFADAVTKAGGEIEPTPEGGFKIAGESFMGIKGSGVKGKDSKINSLKTIYDKSLKGIEKAYGTSEGTKDKKPTLTKQQLVVEKKQAVEAIKSRPDLAEKIKAMYKQETGLDYE